MARNKKGRAGKAARYKAAAANGGPSARYTNQDIASLFLPKAAATHSFSLADEIRHTAHNHGGSESLASLRGRPVTFVSAGVVEPLKELDNSLVAGNKDPKPADLDGTVNRSAKVKENFAVAELGHQGTKANAIIDDGPGDKENATFFVDTTGDKNLSQRHAGSIPIPSPPSPAPSSSASSSGSDEVVFKGRNRQKQLNPRPTVVDRVNIQVQTVEQTMQHISLEPAAEPSPQRDPSPPIPAWQLRGHDDDDDLVADYIANMDDDHGDEEDAQEYHASFQHSFGARDLGGADGDFVLPEESDSDTSPADNDDEDDDDEDNAITTADAASEIDDEALARLLAKQEELGIDEDDLVIASAEVISYNNRFATTSNSRMADYRQQPGENQPWSSVKQGARSNIPNASAVADAFDEMDLMDWGRHNPPRKPKSKRGQPTFDLSDSEMEAHLQATFKKDRLRKKERKLEREELRAAGLLGKHGNPDDLRIKYPTGISIDQIKEEMRTFLQGDSESLTFPPMDSHARKAIHEICLRLNVKSKSTGAGDQRRPILHRTKRTGTYREASFEAAFARPGRKYFHRLDVNKPRGGKGGGTSKPNGRGINQAAFTYRDGEVVGGGAPELGVNNKGRALMEKMGWSAGMALGATDNQGILQPVAHVVKRTKAGLG
ncbi:squalene synthetase-like protein [Gnomoniopsis sp. IMI 355080]|nr:squalene synthetase-like protein [Gnomoniopsis sp. IMI 355080]